MNYQAYPTTSFNGTTVTVSIFVRLKYRYRIDIGDICQNIVSVSYRFRKIDIDPALARIMNRHLKISNGK
jgi:hypothetical protein